MTNERECANAPQRYVRHPQQRPKNERWAGVHEVCREPLPLPNAPTGDKACIHDCFNTAPSMPQVVLSSDAESMMDIVLKLDFGAWEWKRVQRKA